MFAAFVLIISGGFGILQGLAMLISDDQFPGSDTLLSQDATTWGWVQLLVGVVVLLCGFGVLSGNILARTVGVFAALVSLFTTFVGASLAPLWAIIIIAVDIAIIWALTAHGRDYARAVDEL
jgi:hypothetical protein